MSGAIQRHDPRKVDAWVAAMRAQGAGAWQLVQLARGRASIVRRFGATETEGDTFAKETLSLAQADADDTAPGVTTTYALVAADTDGGELGRYTFRASGRTRNIDDAGPEEDPTIAGLVGQHLRHEEAKARFRFGIAAEVNDAYNALLGQYQRRDDLYVKEVERLTRRIEFLETQRDAASDERAKIAERKTENELKIREAEARNARFGKMLGLGLSMLPMLLRQRGADTGLDAEFAAFVQTIEPEQLPKIAAALTAAQQALLASLLKKYLPETPKEAPPVASPN